MTQPIYYTFIVIFDSFEAFREHLLSHLLGLSGLILDQIRQSLLHETYLVAVPAHGLLQLCLNRGLIHGLATLIRSEFSVHACLDRLADGGELLPHHLHLQLILLVLL